VSYSDPQSITINAVANSLARTSSSANAGVFTKDDGNVKLSVSHAYGKRVRRVARVDHRKVAADPLFPAQNTPYTMSVYLVVDGPVTGYSVAELKQVIDGFATWLTASTGANITKLLGGEN
jgi:hypothetical protein